MDETHIYNCGGLPVQLTLPEGAHIEKALHEIDVKKPYWISQKLYDSVSFVEAIKKCAFDRDY